MSSLLPPPPEQSKRKIESITTLDLTSEEGSTQKQEGNTMPFIPRIAAVKEEIDKEAIEAWNALHASSQEAQNKHYENSMMYQAN